MTDYVTARIANRTGILLLDRPKALNSLSLEMVRRLTATLLAWRDDAGIDAVFIGSTSEKALCAGGDIRFFHQAGSATPQTGSPLLDDFFTEEYALNHLVHFYPKPYIALMDGVVMGGGMGIAQGGPGCGLRIVTERSKIAMPEGQGVEHLVEPRSGLVDDHDRDDRRGLDGGLRRTAGRGRRGLIGARVVHRHGPPRLVGCRPLAPAPTPA